MHKFVKELLNGEKVEWKKLSEVAEITSGFVFSKHYQGKTSGDVPFYKVSDMNIPSNEIEMTKANNYINYEDVNTLKVKIFPKGSVIFPKIGATVVTNKKRLLSIPAVVDNNIAVLIPKENILSEFLYFYFQTLDLIDFANGIGAVPSITKATLSEILIPVPSLKVQEVIVNILNQLQQNKNSLVENLNKEKELRLKQYAFYRDKLLGFGEGEVPFKKLGEIGEFIRGNGLTKKELTTEGVPAIHYGQLYTKFGITADTPITFTTPEKATKLRKVRKGDLLIATTSENVKDLLKPTAWHGEEAVISGDMMFFRTEQNVDYIKHFFLTSDIQEYKKKLVTGVNIKRISKDNLMNLVIPVPSLEKQKEIADILETFDRLVNGLTEGLPREIELREKQYCFYRDLLLDFTDKEY